VLREAYLALQDDATSAHFASDFDPATQSCAGTANTPGACKGDSPWTPGFSSWIAATMNPRPPATPAQQPPASPTGPVIRPTPDATAP
jgi:hypothetical protein